MGNYMIERHTASVAVAIVFLVLAAGSAKSNDKSESKDTPAPNATAAPNVKGGPAPKADEAPAPSWVATVKDNCGRYKAAPNEIKKSAIFTENEALLQRSGVDEIKGKLTRLSTGQGGDRLSLKITVGDLEFATESLFAPIKKGSAVYNAAAEMTVGQCVMFSAKGLKASSVVEQSKVCDTEYFANFTSLKPCL